MDEYRPGEWYALCDVCGFQYYASELFAGTATSQKGLRVCRHDLDKQNPQEFVRPKTEKIGVPWSRPQGNEDDITLTNLDPGGYTYIPAATQPPVTYIGGFGQAAIILPNAQSPLHYGREVIYKIVNTTAYELYVSPIDLFAPPHGPIIDTVPCHREDTGTFPIIAAGQTAIFRNMLHGNTTTWYRDL